MKTYLAISTYTAQCRNNKGATDLVIVGGVVMIQKYHQMLMNLKLYFHVRLLSLTPRSYVSFLLECLIIFSNVTCLQKNP